jgi:hypothetical protein
MHLPVDELRLRLPLERPLAHSPAETRVPLTASPTAPNLRADETPSLEAVQRPARQVRAVITSGRAVAILYRWFGKPIRQQDVIVYLSE